MNRKDFLRVTASTIVLLANGKILRASDLSAPYGESAAKLAFRFAVASDGHFGQPDTEYESYFESVVTAINEEHAKHPFEFAVINGDIIHDDKTFLPAAKKSLDALKCKYYVSQGNHDNATPEEWESTWGMPVNFDFTYKKCAFLVATTSNEKGEYLCPDMDWMREKLRQYRRWDTFLFMHINPGKLTKYGVDCPELFELCKKYKNVRAVFNGHDHDEDGIKKRDNIPFIFDAHFGGSWGTVYLGYRIVEVYKNGSVLTYIMNPQERINEERLKG